MNLCSLSDEIKFKIIFLFFRPMQFVELLQLFVLLLFLGILDKFLWRPTPPKDNLRNSLPKSDYVIKLDKNGLDNPVMLD